MFHYGHLLRLLYCSTSQTMNNALSEMELTSAQGHIMGFLAHRSEAPCPKDVEEQFGLSHPTVSGLLARLEKKEFIELRPDAVDRRCKRIYMKPRGRECDQKLYQTILDNEAKIVQGFTEAEKAQFADFLTRAARNMGSEPHTFFTEEESDR